MMRRLNLLVGFTVMASVNRSGTSASSSSAQATSHSGPFQVGRFQSSTSAASTSASSVSSAAETIFRDEVYAHLKVPKTFLEQVRDHPGYSRISMEAFKNLADPNDFYEKRRLACQDLNLPPAFLEEKNSQVGAERKEKKSGEAETSRAVKTSAADSVPTQDLGDAHKAKRELSNRLEDSQGSAASTAKEGRKIWVFKNEVYAKLQVPDEDLYPVTDFPGYSALSDVGFRKIANKKAFKEQRHSVAVEMKMPPKNVPSDKVVVVTQTTSGNSSNSSNSSVAPPGLSGPLMYKAEVFTELQIPSEFLELVPEFPDYRRVTQAAMGQLKDRKHFFDKLHEVAVKLDLLPVPGPRIQHHSKGGKPTLLIFKDEVYAEMGLPTGDLESVPDHLGYSRLTAAAFRRLRDSQEFAKFHQKRRAAAEKLDLPPL